MLFRSLGLDKGVFDFLFVVHVKLQDEQLLGGVLCLEVVQHVGLPSSRNDGFSFLQQELSQNATKAGGGSSNLIIEDIRYEGEGLSRNLLSQTRGAMFITEVL